MEPPGALGIELAENADEAERTALLAEAAANYRAALAAMPGDDPRRGKTADSLAKLLAAIRERTHDVGLFADEAAALRDATATTPADAPDRGFLLTRLGLILVELCGSSPEDDSLQTEAAGVLRDAAVALGHDEPVRAAVLAGLVTILVMQSARGGSDATIAEALSIAPRRRSPPPGRAIRSVRSPFLHSASLNRRDSS